VTAAVLWTATGVLALVLLNGLYVASEFALIGSRRSRLETMARKGNRGARRVLDIIGVLPRLDRAIATVQLGITCASLGLGMYGEHAVAGLLRPLLADLGPAAGAASHGLASVLAVVILTYLHIVIGEVLPKSIALRQPARTALWIEPPLRLTRILLSPFVAVLAGFSGAILRLMRIRPPEETARALSLEEIDTVIEESGAGGALEAGQAELLAKLVDFEELPVRKVMLPRNRVTGLPVTATAAQVMRVVNESSHSRYPVVDSDLDHVIGYVHVKDLMRTLDGEAPFDLRSLCRPIPYIPETATCAGLLLEFSKGRSHLAVALDEHGGTAGIVTLEDLMEEIIGDVEDEPEGGGPLLRVLSPGSAVAHGTCRLDEIRETLGLSLGLEEEQVDTVGGLIVKTLGRLARVGDTVEIEGVRLTVEAADRLSVTRVRMGWES
jgi:CBS domain containing-hemolysin-like protein